MDSSDSSSVDEEVKKKRTKNKEASRDVRKRKAKELQMLRNLTDQQSQLSDELNESFEKLLAAYAVDMERSSHRIYQLETQVKTLQGQAAFRQNGDFPANQDSDCHATARCRILQLELQNAELTFCCGRLREQLQRCDHQLCLAKQEAASLQAKFDQVDSSSSSGSCLSLQTATTSPSPSN